MKQTPSLIGGASIIASVCVGAGMLGLPTAGAGAWTLWSILTLVITMAVMTVSGWFLLEAYQYYNLRVSFHTATKDLLGNKINIINNLSVYFVGGILLYAYTTASGEILNQFLQQPLANFGIDFGSHSTQVFSIILVAICSAIVWHSTRAVDRISLLFIITMIITFVLSITGLTINIDMATLLDSGGLDSGSENSSYAKYALAMFPVALTSFGYHTSVSSIRMYYGDEKRAKKAILGGTIFALILYVLWIVAIFGNLPRQQFAPVIASEGNLDVLLTALNSVINSEAISGTINTFSVVAMLSSFVGVGLGVFDYLADLFNMTDCRKGRTKTWFITFAPPLLMSLLFPTGFLIAIGYAGAVATIWTCIIPALLAKKSREKYYQEGNFTVIGGNFSVYVVIAFGVMTIICYFLAMFHYLPVFKGN